MSYNKIKTNVWKAIFKIGFIKKWYIGHEFLKNPPIIYLEKDDSIVGDVMAVNVTLKVKSGTVINNCIQNTMKLSQYF